MIEKREKIRVLTARYCLSYVWLVNQLNQRGYDISPNELTQYITARRRGLKCERVLDGCIEVLELYGKLFENKKEE